MRVAIACAFAVVAGMATADAQPGPDRLQPPGLTDAQPPLPDTSRSTDRAMVGVAGAVFANYPMSMGDPGIMVLGAKPLWLGNRYRFFQWVADAHAQVGFGGEHLHGYVMAGPHFGFNLYLGSVLGFEMRMGLAGIAQLGERTVGGLVLGGNGGYTLRLWKDDRKRVKLYGVMNMGRYFAADPGNDFAPNAGAFGVGLAYEAPL